MQDVKLFRIENGDLLKVVTEGYKNLADYYVLTIEERDLLTPLANETAIVAETGFFYLYNGTNWIEDGSIIGREGEDGADSTVPGPAGTSITSVTDNKVGDITTITIDGTFGGAPSSFQISDGTDGINSPEVQYEFSINGSTLWHTPFASGDFYQRISTDGGTTWSGAIKFVGEDGTGSGDMLKSENLSGLANYTTARSNLGLNTTANQTDSTDKRFMTDAQETKLDAITGTNTGNETTTTIGTLINGATSKTTPVNADKLGIWDSVSGLLQAVTFANLKATLKTYFDTLYAKVGSVTTSGITQNTGKLLGRNTAGVGVIEEITIGTGLSFSGTTLNASGSSSNVSVTKVAGENITAPAYLRAGNSSIIIIDNIINTTSGYNWQCGKTTSTEYEQGQSITYGGKILKNIAIPLMKVGTGGNITFNIEVFSNASFTTLVGTSINSVTASSLTTSYVSTTFDFSDLVVPTTFYFKVNIVSGSVDVNNFFQVQGSSGSTYAGGINYYINSGGTAGSNGADFTFEINNGYTDTGEDTNKVYKALATSTTYNKVIGALSTTVTAGNNATCILSGEVSGHIGLTPGEVYLLQDNGTVGLTNGSSTIKLGRAISTTQINFVGQITP